MHFTTVFSFIITLMLMIYIHLSIFIPTEVHTELSDLGLDKLASKYSMYWQCRQNERDLEPTEVIQNPG